MASDLLKKVAVHGQYLNPTDRQKLAQLNEKLKGRAVARHEAAAPAGQPATGSQPTPQPQEGGGVGSLFSDLLFGRTGPRGGKQSRGIVEAVATSAARTIGSELGRQVLRGVLGSILGGSKRK